MAGELDLFPSTWLYTDLTKYAVGRRNQLMGAAVLAQCVGALAEALGAEWNGHAQELLVPSMLTGVSNALADSLQKVSAWVTFLEWPDR